MSNGMMNLVFDDKILKSTRRLLMLAIANSTNDDGHGVYGIDTLAADANLVPRQARRVRDELVADGLIFVRVGGGRGQLTNYLITLAVSLGDLIKRLKHYFDFDDSTAETTAKDVIKKRGTFLTKGDKKGDILGQKGGHDYAQKADIPIPHIPNTEEPLVEYNKSAASPPVPEKSTEGSALNTPPADAATPRQEKPQGDDLSKDHAKTVSEQAFTTALEDELEIPPSVPGVPPTRIINLIPLPAGYEWRGIRDYAHLVKANLKTPTPALVCGAKYDGTVVTGPDFTRFIPCAACLSKATASKPTRKPWTDLTDTMHESIPASIRPVGKPNYGRQDRSAKALYEDGFTAERVRAYVEWAYIHDKWFCCGGAGGTPVMMSMSDVSKNIKGYESTKAGTNGTTNSGSLRGPGSENKGLAAPSTADIRTDADGRRYTLHPRGIRIYE